jgi:hypothetical protein
MRLLAALPPSGTQTERAIAMLPAILTGACINERMAFRAVSLPSILCPRAIVDHEAILVSARRAKGDEIAAMGANSKRRRIDPGSRRVGMIDASVLERRNSFQVIGVSTDPITTLVIDFQPFGNRTSEMLPHNAMDHDQFAGEADLPVIAAAAAARPFPAARRQGSRLSFHQAGDDRLNGISLHIHQFDAEGYYSYASHC